MQKEIKPDSKDSDELEILSILVKEYENEYYPFPQPNPLEAIKFRLDQMNKSHDTIGGIMMSAVRPNYSYFVILIDFIIFSSREMFALISGYMNWKQYSCSPIRIPYICHSFMCSKSVVTTVFIDL